MLDRKSFLTIDSFRTGLFIHKKCIWTPELTKALYTPQLNPSLVVSRCSASNTMPLGRLSDSFQRCNTRVASSIMSSVLFNSQSLHELAGFQAKWTHQLDIDAASHCFAKWLFQLHWHWDTGVQHPRQSSWQQHPGSRRCIRSYLWLSTHLFAVSFYRLHQHVFARSTSSRSKDCSSRASSQYGLLPLGGGVWVSRDS